MTTTTPKNDDLAALASQAQGLEAADSGAAPEGDAGGAPEAPGQSNAALLAGTFHLMREVGCALGSVQSPRIVLNDQTLDQLGDAWGRVADKRGWNLQQIMGDYAAEVAAFMLTITIVSRLNKAVRDELATKKPAEAAPAEPAPVAEPA